MCEKTISLFKARPKPHSKQLALFVILRGFCSRLLVYAWGTAISEHTFEMDLKSLLLFSKLLAKN